MCWNSCGRKMHVLCLSSVREYIVYEIVVSNMEDWFTFVCLLWFPFLYHLLNLIGKDNEAGDWKLRQVPSLKCATFTCGFCILYILFKINLWCQKTNSIYIHFRKNQTFILLLKFVVVKITKLKQNKIYSTLTRLS